jgi:hypothetical protein
VAHLPSPPTHRDRDPGGSEGEGRDQARPVGSGSGGWEHQGARPTLAWAAARATSIKSFLGHAFIPEEFLEVIEWRILREMDLAHGGDEVEKAPLRPPRNYIATVYRDRAVTEYVCLVTPRRMQSQPACARVGTDVPSLISLRATSWPLAGVMSYAEDVFARLGSIKSLCSLSQENCRALRLLGIEEWGRAP